MWQFLNRLFYRGKISTLISQNEQLELQLDLAILDLNEAENQINGLKLTAIDAATALRESELARRQLEMDLSAAQERETKAIGYMAWAADKIRDLQAQLAPFKRARKRDERGHFLAESV